MGFFNRTFFKFTFGFLLIVVISLLIMAATSAYAAGLNRIVFTTEPQTVKPKELSLPLTIQVQDASGNSYQTTETLDLEFISTSATGEFLGSTGAPVTETMNKNTANRTFYYRDSSQGSFVITVNATGRDTLQEWSATQNITVSSSASNSSGSSSSNTSSSNTSSSGASQSVSYTGSATTKTTSSSAQLDVSTGGDRITSIGSPISFQAILKKNSVESPLELNWSYGDGYVGMGPLVSHSYKYPGDYVVVLNAKAGEAFSVSRFKVTVIESDISLADASDYIEIFNNGGTEINLFNWKIKEGEMGFIFQPDTILSPHSSIKLEKSLLKIKGEVNDGGIALSNYLGQQMSYLPLVYKVDTEELAKNLENLKKEFLNIQEMAASLGIAYTEPKYSLPISLNLSSEITNFVTPTSTAESPKNIIYVSQEEGGIIDMLTNLIKRVFSD